MTQSDSWKCGWACMLEVLVDGAWLPWAWLETQEDWTRAVAMVASGKLQGEPAELRLIDDVSGVVFFGPSSAVR